jgi:hypothetical protein
MEKKTRRKRKLKRNEVGESSFHPKLTRAMTRQLEKTSNKTKGL